METMSKMRLKIESAERKMNFKSQKVVPTVSTFEEAQPKKEQHNAD